MMMKHAQCLLGQTAKAIEMSFASTTLVGPMNHLLHIATLNAQYLPSYRLIC